MDTARIDAARAALERALDAEPSPEPPRGLHTFTDKVLSDIPQRFTSLLALMKNAKTLRRGLDRHYQDMMESARKATTWAECVAALAHDVVHRNMMQQAWMDMEESLTIYSPAPVVDMVAQWVDPKHMPTFEDYLRHADTGTLCSGCEGPRGPVQACCQACIAAGLCGLCRSHTSDDKAFAIMEGGCSRAHHPPIEADE